MAITLNYTSSLSGVETIADAFASSSDNTITLNGLSATGAYNSGSAVPVTKQAAGEIAMSAGAATLDMRALAGGVGGATVDGNGLKVQFVKLKNKSTNSNPITIVQGIANDYELLGATFSFTLKPGQEILMNLNEAAPDVAAGDKDIDISGTGAEVLQYHFVMG